VVVEKILPPVELAELCQEPLNMTKQATTQPSNQAPCFTSTRWDGLLNYYQLKLYPHRMNAAPGPMRFTARLVSAGEVREPSWIIRYR
jgi:hypothetical protein